MNVTRIIHIGFISLSLASLIFITSCSPYGATDGNFNANPNTTGASITISDPFTPKGSTKKVVNYVNSGSKETFNEIITKLKDQNLETQNKSKIDITDKLGNIVVNFYDVNKKITHDFTNMKNLEVIVQFIENNRSQYHIFKEQITSNNNDHLGFNQLTGKISSKYYPGDEVLKTLNASHLNLDIKCEKPCQDVILVLSLNPSTPGGEVLETYISQSITRAKIEIEPAKGQEEAVKESELYKYIEQINSEEEYAINQVNTTIANGPSRTYIQRVDENKPTINMSIPITDTTKAAAEHSDPKNINFKGAEVASLVLNGAGDDGEAIFDIKFKNAPINTQNKQSESSITSDEKEAPVKKPTAITEVPNKITDKTPETLLPTNTDKPTKSQAPIKKPKPTKAQLATQSRIRPNQQQSRLRQSNTKNNTAQKRPEPQTNTQQSESDKLKPSPSTSDILKLLSARIKITPETVDKKIQEEEINKDFNLKAALEEIKTGNADWSTVNVNPETSLFMGSIEPTNFKRVLTIEAHLEAYREHRMVQKHLNNPDFVDKMCHQYIKNMSRQRQIISNPYLLNNISPSFASLMAVESPYGSKYKNFDIYHVYISPACETSSGPNQITDGTFQTIIDKKYGLAGSLINSGFKFKYKNSKKHSLQSSEDLCKIETPNIRNLDDRMKIETASILASSYLSYIFENRHPEDAAMAFAAYNQGPWAYTNMYDVNRERHKAFKSTLADVWRFKMSSLKEKPRGEKRSISEVGESLNSGSMYAFQALATRAILTQPQEYCGQSTDHYAQMYETAKQEIKNKSTDYYESMNLFRSSNLNPSGPVLQETKNLLK